jgi:hypothetical protein
MQINSLSKSPRVRAIVVQYIFNLASLTMPIFFIPAYAHHKGCISCPQPSCKHLVEVEKWLNTPRMKVWHPKQAQIASDKMCKGRLG